jgi:hypothetical protein
VKHHKEIIYELPAAWVRELLDVVGA